MELRCATCDRTADQPTRDREHWINGAEGPRCPACNTKRNEHNAARTPYSDAEREWLTKTYEMGTSSDELANELAKIIGRYEATLAQYEIEPIDVELTDQFARDHGVVEAYNVLRRWNAGLETQKRQFQDLCLKNQGERDDAERRLTHYLNDAISVPDGTFLQQLAGEIRGWGKDETGPTTGYANDVADSLEDLAVAISKEDRS